MDQSLLIKDFPQDERPRERLVSMGASSLSNHELIAILLRTGTKDESVLQLSNRIFNAFWKVFNFCSMHRLMK